MNPLTPEQLEKEQENQIWYEQWCHWFEVALSGAAAIGVNKNIVVSHAAAIATVAVTEVRLRKPKNI